MSRHTRWIAALVLGFLAALSANARAADDELKNLTDNANSLIREYRGKLKFTCSSFWPTWGPEKAFDGLPRTSWFTERGDAAALKKKPWIAVEFPQAVTVRRVTILPNREPPWETGYTILVGRLELLDEKGKVLFSSEDEVGGVRPNMEARPQKPVSGVHRIRFASFGDEGNKNPYDDVAIGEILVE
jgi:hypothetical protein